jgi:hypothetical protein
MVPKGAHEFLCLAAHVRQLSFLLMIVFAFVPAFAAKTANLKGIIYTVGKDRVQTLWPNARVLLKNAAAQTEFTAVSNDLGAYSFTEVLIGEYEVTVSLAGFETTTKRVTLKPDETAQLNFELALATQKQTVEVTAEAPGVDLTSSSSGGQVITQSTLRSVVQLNQDFQDALPLLPGVTRGLEGEIHIKGGRTNQTSTLVNTASVADPFTGQPALRLPAIAVQSVQVLSNPFSAEYGKFASGVVEVNTRGGTDQWKFLFEDPIPRFRWIDGRTHGVESASPHLTFAGPIKRGKLYIFQSLLYGYDTVRVPSLPDPNNVRVQESVTTYTQVDWNPLANQRFTAVATVDPQETKFANIDTFDPQPVTEDYRQRGFFASLTHRWILGRGGFLQSLFAAKRLDSSVFPANTSAGKMTLFPEQNSGSFFEQQDRRTRLYQWSQTFHAWPMEAAGRHLLTAGYAFARSNYSGQIGNWPVRVLRDDNTLASTITFAPQTASAVAKNEVSFFVQDNWQIASRFTLDLGVRFDHDNLSAEAINVAPRIGFVFAPTRDGRTAIRGGFGVFFDKIPINVSIFPQFPVQTITSFAADGVTALGGPATYLPVIATSDQQLRVPYSLGWTLQFDRELRRGLLLRLGYEGRDGHREFFVNPLQTNNNAALGLYNSGRQTYREYLAMLRWKPRERMTIYGSYVYSQARGELNDYNQFFGNFPYPLIRANQFGPLSSDAPHRGLIWGVIPLPKKFDFVPILDVHTGFPYSRLDANWNYVGERNQAGRRPTFIGFDTKLQYPVDFTFRKHHIQFRAGLTVLNVLNHFNPRDVQQYGPSPNYGQLYNSVGRQFRIDGDFDF